MVGKFPESAFAHKYLDDFGYGAEIGGSAHNDWGLDNIINIDYTEEMTIFKEKEIELCGQFLRVDIVAEGNHLPQPDSHFDYLINSHVIEHIPNIIGTITEWHRVVRAGGRILFMVPDRDRSSDDDKAAPYTTLAEFFEDYRLNYDVDTKPLTPTNPSVRGHYYQFHKSLFADVLNVFFSTRLKILDSLDTDDKVGNSFMFMCEVIK